jgi:predicted glycoside hydrolase/deacetylase ChbG (UPF0249 family)
MTLSVHGPHGLRRRICVVADDFGLHPGIDAAILELAETRTIQALGCMTGGASWPSSAQALRGRSSLTSDIGLHLDLTERPLDRAPQPLRSLILAAYTRRLDRRSIRAEIRLQLNAFEAALGREPDYIDGHQHVHQLPGVRAELLDELAARYRSNQQPWLRCTVPAQREVEATPPASLPVGIRLKAAVIASLGGYALRREAKERGFRMNAALTGVYGFDTDAAAYQSLLAGWLAHAADGSVLMCHPSHNAESGDPIGGARLNEYQVLASGALERLLARFGFHAQPMRAILSSDDTPHSAQPVTEDDIPEERGANPH